VCMVVPVIVVFYLVKLARQCCGSLFVVAVAVSGQYRFWFTQYTIVMGTESMCV
jgi:hypothetical protein